MIRPQQITVLGATGSVGLSTLDVIARHPELYQVFALTGFSRLKELLALCVLHSPRFAVVPQQELARNLQDALAAAGLDTRVLVGESGLCEVAAHPQVDTVLAAIVGAAGLRPTLAAVEAGKKVLLANKEALVMSGALFMQAVHRSGAVLLPIDSEHNAIFQCLPADYSKGLGTVGVRRILLTASGGPFRETPLADLMSVSPEQACAHPNWSMGRKISVDSASMMNKGLELIERAGCSMHGRIRLRWLFIRKASFTPWSITLMAQCWRSWVTRTCAHPLLTRWPGRDGSIQGLRRLTCSVLRVWIFRRQMNIVFHACGWRVRRLKPETVPRPC